MTLPVDNLTKPGDLADTANGQLADPPLAGFALPERPTARLHHIAARAFRAFFAEVFRLYNVELSASSTVDCYRNYTVQRSTFLARYTTTPLEGRPTKRWNGVTYWQRPGTNIAATPGASNHGWGLAVDVAVAVPLNGGGHTIVGITSRPDVLQWMLDNAARYGLSWEAQSEPWHIRYNTGDTVPQAVLDYEAGQQPPTIERTTLNVTKTTLRPELRDQLRGNQDVVLLQVQALGLFHISGNADFDCGSADGDYGPRTQQAAKVMQALSKVPVDGVVGPMTWSALLNTDGQ